MATQSSKRNEPKNQKLLARERSKLLKMSQGLKTFVIRNVPLMLGGPTPLEFCHQKQIISLQSSFKELINTYDHLLSNKEIEWCDNCDDCKCCNCECEEECQNCGASINNGQGRCGGCLDDEDEEEECQHCGTSVNLGCDLCDDCLDNEEEEEDEPFYCENCAAIEVEWEGDLCSACNEIEEVATREECGCLLNPSCSCL